MTHPNPVKDLWYHCGTASHSLHYVSLEITGVCNANCSFCYVDGSRGHHMAPRLLTTCISQIKSNKVKRIQISGGEPTLHPQLVDIVAELSSAGIAVLIATNGLRIDERLSRELFDAGAHIGLSFETTDSDLHDALVGVPNAHARKLAAVKALLAVGFADESRFDVIVKALRGTRHTLVDVWRWSLARGIRPILDRAIPTGRCEAHEPLEGEELFQAMQKLHKLEYADQLRLPFVGNEPCDRLGNGFHIRWDGAVFPCGGLQFPELVVGYAGESSFDVLYSRSSVMDECRGIYGRIHGHCGRCTESPNCTGCRAVAYTRTRDLLAPDGGCWRRDGQEKHDG